MDNIEAKLVAIHSIAQTEGGRAMVEFADATIEVALNKLSEIEPFDSAGIAKAQAAIMASRGVKWFLKTPLEVMLKEYGIELEEDDA